MPSAAFELLAKAIAEKSQVACNYQGYSRQICPHTLGYTDGHERVLAFQFAGGSSRTLPPGGQWRCMNVGEMSDLKLQAGAWHTATDHSQPQTCVKNVTLEVAH